MKLPTTILAGVGLALAFGGNACSARETRFHHSALFFAIPPGGARQARRRGRRRFSGGVVSTGRRTTTRQFFDFPTRQSCDDESSATTTTRVDDGRELREIVRTFVPILAAAVVFAVASAASAVDHPADYASLGIPDPIPGLDPRYFLSGGLCAAASHGATTPIDFIKTKMQAEPETYDGMGLWAAGRDIVARCGPGALLGGLGPTVVGYGVEGAVKFGLYESLKPTVARMLSTGNPAVPYLLASVAAGAAASLFLCPMERTRIRLVTDPSYADGLLSALPKLVREDGVGSLFSGMPAMLSKQVPYTATKQVTFDVFAGILYAAAANANLASTDIKIQVAVGAAFLSSILSCIASHPGDVLLTATYKGGGQSTNEGGQQQQDGGGGASSKSRGFAQLTTEIYQTKGVGGFFTGISARFVHVGAIITSQLVLYDVIKQSLGLPATGAH